MKGLTTSGLTADDAHTADQVIEDLEDELRATHDALQDQVTRNDLLSQFVLEVGAESEDNGPEGGAS